MKAVLLSIRPKWCAMIASGIKTLEVRKTYPKLEMPFKVYIYCTGGLTAEEHRENSLYKFRYTVFGEFVCDKYIGWRVNKTTWLYDVFPNELAEACLTGKELEKYGGGEYLYGWYISQLKIYDTPRALSEFGLSRPPQSWCYVEEPKGSEDAECKIS